LFSDKFQVVRDYVKEKREWLTLLLFSFVSEFFSCVLYCEWYERTLKMNWITENTYMVEVVLLDLPCCMDLEWIGFFSIWRWHAQTWGWTKGCRICEEVFWVWTWFSWSRCNCGGWFLSFVRTHLCLWNQSIQLPTTLKSTQCSL